MAPKMVAEFVATERAVRAFLATVQTIVHGGYLTAEFVRILG